VQSLASMMEKDIKWGMTHAQVTDVYNRLNGLFDREYAPQLAKMQPGTVMQAVEQDRDNRKSQFDRAYTRFLDTPTGYDATALRPEYTYKNDEAIQPLFKDGKTRYFFYIKDKLWKVYDEIPLKADGPLGAAYPEAVTKLNQTLGTAARIRAADPAKGLDRTTADWQDTTTHLRAVDRSGEHIVAVVLEDRQTLTNIDTLRVNKPVDPFAIDPAIAAITNKGVTDPNAANAASSAKPKNTKPKR
jgi:hypothetical protein